MGPVGNIGQRWAANGGLLIAGHARACCLCCARLNVPGPHHEPNGSYPWLPNDSLGRGGKRYTGVLAGAAPKAAAMSGLMYPASVSRGIHQGACVPTGMLTDMS